MTNLENANKTNLLSKTIKTNLKDHIQTIFLADKPDSLLSEYSLFLRRLRREVMSNQTLMKCGSEDVAELHTLLF